MSISTSIRGLGGRRRVLALVALLASVAVAAAALLVGGSGRTGVARSGGAVAAASPIAPGQVLKLTPAQAAQLRQMTNTPAKRRAFDQNLQRGLGAFGLHLAPERAASPAAHIVTTAYQGAVSVEPVFSQGWSRDHWWLIASYADFAYGGTAAATAACSVYLPWWICVPVGGIVASWISGWGSGNNHGIWLAVYRYGWITGGRW